MSICILTKDICMSTYRILGHRKEDRTEFFLDTVFFQYLQNYATYNLLLSMSCTIAKQMHSIIWPVHFEQYYVFKINVCWGEGSWGHSEEYIWYYSYFFVLELKLDGVMGSSQFKHKQLEEMSKSLPVLFLDSKISWFFFNLECFYLSCCCLHMKNEENIQKMTSV